MAPAAKQPVFYYDLGSPECYLMAETVLRALPVVPEWEPVPAHRLAPAEDAQGHATPGPDRTLIELRAAQLGLQPLRWPRTWPPDTRMAMLAATFAKRAGRAVAFSLAAFRQSFAGGRDLGDENTVLLAGAACELHPAALLKGIALRSVSEALHTATARAAAAGVCALPALEHDGEVFAGDDAISRLACALGIAA